MKKNPVDKLFNQKGLKLLEAIHSYKKGNLEAIGKEDIKNMLLLGIINEKVANTLNGDKINTKGNPIMKNKKMMYLLVMIAGAGALYYYMKKSNEAKALQSIKDLNQSSGTINFNTVSA